MDMHARIAALTICLVVVAGCKGRQPPHPKHPSILDVTGPTDPHGGDRGCSVATTPHDPPQLPAKAFDYPVELADSECTQTAVLFNNEGDKQLGLIGGRLWLCRGFTKTTLKLQPSLMEIERKEPGLLHQEVDIWTPEESARFQAFYSSCVGQPKPGWAFVVEVFRSGPPVGGPCTGGCDAGR